MSVFYVFLFLLALVVVVMIIEWRPFEEKTKDSKGSEELLPLPPARKKPSNSKRVHTAAQTIARKCVVDCDKCGQDYGTCGRVHIITPEGSGWVECPLCKGTKQRKVTVKFCASCGKMLAACTCDES